MSVLLKFVALWDNGIWFLRSKLLSFTVCIISLSSQYVCGSREIQTQLQRIRFVRRLVRVQVKR
jgi:hypothetical protein